MNQFASKLSNRLENRFARDSDSKTNTEWLCEHTTLRGRPFSVKDYEFQRAIIDDEHPNLSVIKPSQVGLTEAQIRKALAFCRRRRGVSAIFSLPSEKLYNRVASTRVKPLVDKDKVFNLESDEGAIRQKGLIQLDQSFLYLTPCTEGDATSTSADAVFNDEVDLSPQDMLALFQSRLQGSKIKISQGFSTPTFPNYGIDAMFQSSDQHMYLIRCEACNHHNAPHFSRRFIRIPGLPDFIDELTEIDAGTIDDIDIDGSYVMCEKCQTPLDLSNPDLREWVPKYPGRTHSRGYKVSPFSVEMLDPAYIITQLLKYKQRQFLRGFYNTVLGETYTDGDIQLSHEAISDCMGHQAVPEVGADRPACIGIDMGDTCHAVIGDANGRDVWEFKPVSSNEIVEFVESRLERYNIVAGGIDRNPYTPTANRIRQISDGKIMPIEYAVSGPDFKEVKDELGEMITHFRANRTRLLDDVAGAVRGSMFDFNGYGMYEHTLIEHLRDLVRDEEPEKPAKWKKLTGQDHYFHALGYYRAGIKIKHLIEDLDDSDKRTSLMCGRAQIGKGDQKLVGISKRIIEKGPLGV